MRAAPRLDIDDDLGVPSRTLAAIWRRRVEADPEGPLLWFAGRFRHTVGDFDVEVRCAASAFRRRGIRKGDRVCVLMHNSPAMLAAMLGLWQTGAVVVPLSAQLVGALLADQVRRAKPVLVVADDELAPRLADCAATVLTRSSLDAERAIANAGAACADRDQAPADDEPAYQDPALILFTSGSTGPSKGCILSHHFCVYYGWLFWRYMGYRNDDTLYSCLPLNHVHALFASFLPAVLAGAQFSFAERFSASRYWQEIADSRATTCSAIGPMASILLGQPVAQVEDRLGVRLAHIAPAPPRAQEFEQRFGLRVVSTLYGMTEGMIFPPDPARAPVLGVIGTAPTDWDVAIHDPLGHPVAPGEAGELVARPRRARILFDAYLDMPAETVEAWRGLWYHTGDVCRCDGDGVYWFMGRTRDVIRRGGENVSAWEIESIVGGCRELSEAAAVPIAGRDGEEEVVLFAKRIEGSGFTVADIHAYCDEALPRYMRPDHIAVQDADLPKTQSGKIDKVALRAAFERTRSQESSA